MSQKLAVSFILTLLTGCGQLQSPASQAPAAARPAGPEIRWVVADTRKLTEAVEIAIINADPDYQTEKKRYADSKQAQQLLREQIDELEQAGKRKCIDERGNPRQNDPNNSSSPLNTPMLRGFSRPSRLSAEIQRPNKPSYWDCVKTIAEDPLISDLRTQQSRFGNIEQQRRNTERERRQRAETILSKLAADYGQAHGYPLILNNISQYVLFNRNKVVLDVTDDLLDYIAAHPEATQPPAVAADPAVNP
ncbi:hypothetical protein KFZ76_20685 [Methylovulum psychrotolerans]|uniref:hypothetical protein n=1 Tax=Methylovulum psychrotolerans TaxID=1704499 RepID=UPI001BFFB467|nr:hypothetical protein [Methylovulum psychrotolerans]MBT9100124.1 hypothetical protein [Methylovulum psychrotolerans]